MKKDCTVSSGNVFADLGLPNPEELLAKAEITFQINALIKKKKLTQAATAKLLKIDPSKVSALNYGKLSEFSLEQLFRFLNILGQDIKIRIVPKRKSRANAEVSVTVPAVKKIIPIKPSTSSRVSIQAKKKARAR